MYRYFLVFLIFVPELASNIMNTYQDWSDAILIPLAEYFIEPAAYDKLTPQYDSLKEIKYVDGATILLGFISALSLITVFIRISEPLVFLSLIETFCICCCSRRSKSDVRKGFMKYDGDSLCSFINSAMDTDYVIIIISGIHHSLMMGPSN